MKKISMVLTLMLMTFIFCFTPTSTIAAQDPFLDAEFTKAEETVPAFNFILENLDGEQTRLSDYRGKVVMILFWASW